MSDYFAAMFTSDVREAKQEEVKMEGVDPDALWVLVQYAYTGMFIWNWCLVRYTPTRTKFLADTDIRRYFDILADIQILYYFVKNRKWTKNKILSIIMFSI